MDTLQLLVNQLLELDELLASADPRSEQYGELVDARANLFETWLELQHHYASDTFLQLQLTAFAVGTFCLAPRLHDRTWALAIVIQAHEQQRTIKWLRPRSSYELRSPGITMPIELLKPYLPGSDITDSSTTRYDLGQRVLVLYHDGVWYEANILRVYRKGLPSADDNCYLEVQYRDYHSEPQEVICKATRVCKLEDPSQLQVGEHQHPAFEGDTAGVDTAGSTDSSAVEHITSLEEAIFAPFDLGDTSPPGLGQRQSIR